jgi:hypothetical protein
LVDLADRPVNRLPGRPRKDAVDAGVERLADLIAEAKPERIVVVKASIASAVRAAAARASFDGDVVELPFPVRQWRAEYVRRLASVLPATGNAGRSTKGRRTGRRSAHGQRAEG